MRTITLLLTVIPNFIFCDDLNQFKEYCQEKADRLCEEITHQKTTNYFLIGKFDAYCEMVDYIEYKTKND